jgi:hypothetical protein
MRSLAAATALLLLGPPADAATVEANYVARVAGFRVMTVDVQATIDVDSYHVAARLRSSGLAALATSFDQTAIAEGRLLPDGVRPARFRIEGDWQGEQRRVELALAAAPARILLDPPEVPEREPVPPSMARDSIDTLTALVAVSRQVARDGAAGCHLAATMFNGRRLTRVTLTPAGEGPVPGHADLTAVRCRVEARQVAGFWRGWDRAQAERPQSGMVWIAAPVANAPPMPVRLEMGVDWLGTLVVSLDQARLAPIGPLVAR